MIFVATDPQQRNNFNTRIFILPPFLRVLKGYSDVLRT